MFCYIKIFGFMVVLWDNETLEKQAQKETKKISTLILSDLLLLGVVALHYYMGIPLIDQKSSIPVAMGKTEVRMFHYIFNMETKYTALSKSLRF